MEKPLETLLAEVRGCRICEAHLPLGPRPVVRAHPESRILIVGQAPGTKVHATGIPWNDPSGDRLRDWLQMDRATFYDSKLLAIVPMGFCYPGKGKSGDLPPRPECAPLWHERIRHLLPKLQLTLLIGQYAQRYYLGQACHKRLADTVRHYADYLPAYFPLPHPSPRNRLWLRQNAWFEVSVVPELRQKVHGILASA